MGTHEEYSKKRAEALEALHGFIKQCGEKGFTIQQLSIIGQCANDEISKVISNIHNKTKLTADQCDLP